MNNYNFEKYIFKKNKEYYLELNLPNNFTSFIYKIYGNEGYYNCGKFKSYINNGNNRFIINIGIPQIIFITLTLNNEGEYFDFINMKNEINNNLVEIKQNIKLNIIRKENINLDKLLKKNINTNLLSNIESDEESDDSSESSSDDSSNIEEEKQNETYDEKYNIIYNQNYNNPYIKNCNEQYNDKDELDEGEDTEDDDEDTEDDDEDTEDDDEDTEGEGEDNDDNNKESTI